MSTCTSSQSTVLVFLSSALILTVKKKHSIVVVSSLKSFPVRNDKLSQDNAQLCPYFEIFMKTTLDNMSDTVSNTTTTSFLNIHPGVVQPLHIIYRSLLLAESDVLYNAIKCFTHFVLFSLLLF